MKKPGATQASSPAYFETAFVTTVLRSFINTPPDQLIARLGYGGLLPFAGLTALTWLVRADLVPFVAAALVAYSALIASFLGGIHWGIGFKRLQAGEPLVNFHFLWGITPSLLAWVALVMPPLAGLPLLGLVLLGCYGVDRKTYPPAGLRRWLTLRFHLTVVATLSCILSAAAV